MTVEQRTILDLLCGNGVSGHVDWQQVYQLSVEQGVAAVVFDAVQRLYAGQGEGLALPGDVKLQWYALQRRIEVQNRKVNKVLCQVVGLLNENDIPSVLLKGQGLARLYENPLHRLSGDIDLYVGAENYSLAKALFANRGWLDNGEVHEDIKHLCFCIDGVSIELHYYAAIIPGRRCNRRFQEMMASALKGKGEEDDCFHIDGVRVRTLPIETNVVYTFVHLFKHFIEGGIRLRQLTDWLLLLRKLGAVDSARMRKQLEAIGHLEAWQAFGCVMAGYFAFDAARFPCYSDSNGGESKAERIISLTFNDANSHSMLNTHADGMIAKCKVLISLCKNFSRVFRLFPGHCSSYSLRLLMNAATKQMRKLQGTMH